MNDELFDTLWEALVEHGSSRKSRDAVKRYWDTLTPKQQALAHHNILRKLQADAFVQYDPIRAIKENIRTHQAVEPVNYNGRSLAPGEQYVIARYKGAYGTYSLEDAREFGMEIKQIFTEPIPSHSRTNPEPLSRDKSF